MNHLNPLLYLDQNDFSFMPPQTQNEPGLLVNNVRGLCLVFFTSIHCAWCQTLMPSFKFLPSKINGCQFGVVNINVNNNTNTRLLEMSKYSNTPINHVPFLVLYYDGMPYDIYQGKANDPNIVQNIIQFIITSAEQIQIRRNQHQKQGKKGKLKFDKNLQAVLKCDDEVCYLEVSEAYH